MLKSKTRIAASKGIELCEQYLFEGLTRETILQRIAKISKSSARTIDTWIKEARPKAQERQGQAEQERKSLEATARTEAIKEGLKSDLELESFLCQIALGDLKIEEVIAGESIIRNANPFERIAAIKEVFKKRGSYAPVKTDLTSGGEKIQPQTTIKTADGKVITL